MRRRRLLALGLLAAAGTAGVIGRGPGLVRAAVNRWRPEPILDRTGPTGHPTDTELATLQALGARLLPSTAGPAGAAFVRRYVLDQSARVPGMLTEYRRAAALLDTTGADAPQPFAARNREAQDRTLHELFPPFTPGDRAGRLRARLFAPRGSRSVRTFVVSDLVRAYYASAHGWALVGYTHAPGVGATDPLEYTRVPAPAGDARA